MRRKQLCRFASAACLAVLSVDGGASDTAWFVVAERGAGPHGDAFLLPLSDERDIAAARRFLRDGPASGVGSIASVRIAAGGDGFNRDWRADGQPAWSWRVVAFEGFADVTIELCDGWPGLVEQDVAGFIANTGGRACFWGYAVAAELAQAPAFQVGEHVDGSWFNPATPGQGLLIDVLPEQGLLSLGWFTYAETPTPGAPASDQRWLAGLGALGPAGANLRLTRTLGGAFNSPRPVQHIDVGAAVVRFLDCNRAEFDFAFDSGGTGRIPLMRIPAREGCVRR